MAYSDQSGGPYPSRDMREPGESQYPPPPGEEDDRNRAYHQRTHSNAVTLPSISPFDPQYAVPNGYPSQRGSRPDPYTSQGAYGRDERGGYQAEYPRATPAHFPQSAPRQRTAIACRYCRRRKIRCSGYEHNTSGRCSNCQRFQQECIFTPVSAQTQAFVPAHAAYPHMRNMAVGPDGRARLMYPPSDGTQLYGAHGQPLGQIPLPPASSPYQEYAVPSPTSPYGSSFTDDRDQSSKRPQAESHSSILPPPISGQSPYPRQDSSRRQAAEEDLRLPPVTPNIGTQTASGYSPGSSASENSGLRTLPEGLSMARTPPPRNSPVDRGDPMAIGNVMEKRPDNAIDKNMLNRLDRKT